VIPISVTPSGTFQITGFGEAVSNVQVVTPPSGTQPTKAARDRSGWARP
jgi:hypothetical protein